MPGVAATEEAPALKAVALSKLKCQLEELQQHNNELSADNDKLKNKNAALQQVCTLLAGQGWPSSITVMHAMQCPLAVPSLCCSRANMFGNHATAGM